MIKKFLLCLLLLFTFIIPLSVNADTSYYVSPTGDDANYPCASTESPCQTLGKFFRIGDNSPATDKVLHERAGGSSDWAIVYLMDGTHIVSSEYGAGASTEWIGIEGSYIKLLAAPGHSPILQSPTNVYDDSYGNVVLKVRQTDVSNPSTRSNIVIDGIEIIGGYSFALKIEDHYSYVTVSNNDIHASGVDCMAIKGADINEGGQSTTNNITVEYNEIYDCGQRDDTNAEGMDVMSLSTSTIRYNYIHDTPTVGMYFKGNSNNITVEKNFLYNTGTSTNAGNCGSYCDEFGGIYLGESSDAQYIPSSPNNYECMNSIVRYNVIANSHGNSLRAMGCKSCEFYNNTIYTNIRRDAVYYDWIITGDFHIVRETSTPPYETNSDITFSNNLVLSSTTNWRGNYLYDPPLVFLQSSIWTSGDTESNLTADYNYYWRDVVGERFWRDRTTYNLGRTTLSSWQADYTTIDANSVIIGTGDIDNYINTSTISSTPNRASSYERLSGCLSTVGANEDFDYGIDGQYSYDGDLQATSSIQGTISINGTITIQ